MRGYRGIVVLAALAATACFDTPGTRLVVMKERLVKVYSGNMWSPAELVADLKATAAPAH